MLFLIDTFTPQNDINTQNYYKIIKNEHFNIFKQKFKNELIFPGKICNLR